MPSRELYNCPELYCVYPVSKTVENNVGNCLILEAAEVHYCERLSSESILSRALGANSGQDNH